jgi:hypothetical protein
VRGARASGAPSVPQPPRRPKRGRSSGRAVGADGRPAPSHAVSTTSARTAASTHRRREVRPRAASTGPRPRARSRPPKARPSTLAPGPSACSPIYGRAAPRPEAFRTQLAWRDFYGALLAVVPERAATIPGPHGRPGHDADPDGWVAWTTGRTGNPLVDAGMHQLLAEGCRPNRVRMVTASFLVKDLRQDWRHGAGHSWHKTGVQPARVAVDCRHRRRLGPPDAQSPHPGQTVRPRRHLRAAVGARAGRPGHSGDLRALASLAPARGIPAPHRRPRGAPGRGARPGATPPLLRRPPPYPRARPGWARQ